jgi:chitodextrinase
MAEFKLDRFKYNWKGSWQAGTEYKRDDIVRVNGKSYVCVLTHTSSGTFGQDLNAILPDSNPPQPQPRWIVMTSGKSFIGAWSDGVSYNLGDLVVYYGSLWLCTGNHVSNNFADDSNNWEVFTKSIQFVGNWQADTTYGHGALVRYNGIVYKCIIAHQSGSILEDNAADWEMFFNGILYQGVWQTETEYRPNDLVKYGGSTFRCTTTHTTEENFNEDNFVMEFPGFQHDGVWSPETVYNEGDVVTYGGYQYFATANNTDIEPSGTSNDSTNPWIILSKSYNFQGQWDIDGVYKTGDIVQRGGYLYLAMRDIAGAQDDGSSLDYLDPETWELLVIGKKFAGNWQSNRLFSIGEVVYHLGSAYVCNFEHVSSNENFPGDNGNIYNYWDLLLQSGQPGGLHDKGDLLTYGLSREIVGDGSTLGDTRVPIGTSGQVLSVTEDLEVFWRTRLNDSDVVFVSAYTGVDDDTYGVSLSRPFKTIRYAAEYVEDNFQPGRPVKIFISTGRYEEIGPISVNAGCAVVGDELRSTTVVATPPIVEYQNDYQYVDDYIDHFYTFLFDLLNGNPITPTEGNTEPQVLDVPRPDLNVANKVVELSEVWKQYVTFRVEDGEVNPEIVGTSEATTNTFQANGSTSLELNIKFIASEILAYLRVTYPTIDWNMTRIKSDVKSLIRGIYKDLRLSESNHYTILSARRYANAVLGSQNDDLFYMRDTTGLRNMTTDGLTGSLNPPGVFDLYQRPTGGSCVSLDPGWGPDDESVWISKRSPYIQGVTNIGDRCVGMKVDGSLHNGGNKSMTANDFTQVLSDGIGAWISNNGRAELVSVFTYYCQVGYFAEDGGVIRATNGNNSYGSFGSIADGNDPTESPQVCTLNNRNNEAQVETAFSGGTTDEIIIFEYSNTGEHYTSASAEIVGAGNNASVRYSDFRDNAIFNARLINTTGSGQAGGSNYLVRQGSAQITPDSTSTIRLSNSDATQFEEEIAGMRILITSGRGVGQYGYIQAFNPVTRDVTVYKDSDDTAGWDHLIPGTPIVPDFDSTAQYRIEPRITVSHPGFSATSYAFNTERTFVDMTYGNITRSFVAISGQTGSGETAGLEPSPATFDIVRNGSVFEVTLNDSGIGYAVQDTITISGDLVGETSPENDITITVTEVTDDSTNSIADFTFLGTPGLARFVALAQPNFVYYGEDGEEWDEVTLPFTGDLKKVVAGNNNFVAIPRNQNRIAYSNTAEGWTTRSLPVSSNWSDAVYGNDKFVIVSSNTDDVVYSTDGLNWSATQIPEDTEGDSTVSSWSAVTYGFGKYIAVSNNDRSVAVSNNGITWERLDNVLPDPGIGNTYDFIGLEYGNNRIVALDSSGIILYSLDGEVWYEGTTIPNIDEDRGPDTGIVTLEFTFTQLKYSQGVFFAISNTDNEGTPVNRCITTEDGIKLYDRNLDASQRWTALSFANLNGTPTWVALASSATVQGVNHIVTGAQAKLRADVFQGKFETVKIWDPGSGYTSVPTYTVTDTQFVSEVEFDLRLGDGSLGQPDFINRGIGYRTNSTRVTITGDGYADIIPEANTITLSGCITVPGPGVQIRIDGVLDELTEDPDDLKLFSGVIIEDLGDDGSGNQTRLVKFTISPGLENEYNLEHGRTVFLRSRYSQARITGHDFLDIGTGNFEETNYPEVYAGGNFFTAAPENEVLEINGGRVFYVSSDQDGNFRTGELFSVQQATGIVTISAEFFELDGLSELSLGGVRLGGSGAVVREFSTDPAFSEDSNNVVPTQRAIASFLADRLSVGGENLETNDIRAGRVQVGSEENRIENSADFYINIPVPVILDGVDEFGNRTNVSGTIISQMLYFRNVNDTVQ